MSHPAPDAANDWYAQQPPSTAALMLMSGVPRRSSTTLPRPSWKPGLLNTADRPPPPAPKPSFHTTSGWTRLPELSKLSCAPPTEVTSGSEAGQEFTGYGYSVCPSDSASVEPKSPDAASTVTWRA